MSGIAERFVRLASGRLFWFNLIALVALKFLLPLGTGGLATIADPLRSVDLLAVLQGTNSARLVASLRPLERSPTLDTAAAQKLADMAARGYFAHVGPDGIRPWDFISRAGYSYSVAGENLGRGFYDGSALVQAWMGSPSHRDNLLNPRYRHMGLASGKITLNGKETMVVVQMFGTPVVPEVAEVPTAVPPVAVAAPEPVIEPMAVSTDPGVALVSAPKTVRTVSGVTSEQVARPASGILATELALILALLTVCIAVLGAHRRLFGAWALNAALLALVTLIPAASRIVSGVIF